MSCYVLVWHLKDASQVDLGHIFHDKEATFLHNFVEIVLLSDNANAWCTKDPCCFRYQARGSESFLSSLLDLVEGYTVSPTEMSGRLYKWHWATSIETIRQVSKAVRSVILFFEDFFNEDNSWLYFHLRWTPLSWLLSSYVTDKCSRRYLLLVAEKSFGFFLFCLSFFSFDSSSSCTTSLMSRRTATTRALW